jgi:hypothetical protein
VVTVVDPLAVEAWIRVHAEPVGAMQTVHERPWATVLRVPLVDGVALRHEERPVFDTDFSTVLRRAVAQTLGSASS